jgi:hypothetical protein
VINDQELQRMLVLDAAPGPALPISAADAAAIIDTALDGAGFGPGGGDGAGGSSASGSAGRAVATGAKLAIIGGAALLVIVVALMIWRGRHRDSQQVAAVMLDAAIIDAATGAGSATPPAAPLETAPADAAVVDPADDEVTIDPLPSRPPRRDKRRDSAADDATDLLGEANAKRAAKQWRESDVLYARVVKRAPKSFAAQAALIASASLHLEHLGDPKGAAQRFRRALSIAPTGALAEDARWGIAEAARANHDPKAEAAALDELLAHHGQSPLAQRAKARRAELR